jgi:hypothetical protein
MKTSPVFKVVSICQERVVFQSRRQWVARAFAALRNARFGMEWFKVQAAK